MFVIILALKKKQSDINIKAADMWSFAIVLWELATRNVPFADLSPMEAGMKVNDLSRLFTAQFYIFVSIRLRWRA